MRYKNIIVAGSIAFDFIFKYEGAFQDHFDPNSLHNVNTCFFAPSRKRFFGGCGGNIAYSASLFGVRPMLVSVAGKDFSPEYKEWLSSHNIDLKYVLEVQDGDTAAAYITTDKNGNKLTTFYPGAYITTYDLGIDLKKYQDSILIVGPMNMGNMEQLCLQAIEAGVDYVFDPGQQITLFSADQMKKLCENAFLVILNEYEFGLASKNVDFSKVKRYIVTKGEKGSECVVDGKSVAIPVVKPKVVADPTGCGDAYRGGLLYGLSEGRDLVTACRMGALCATYSIEKEGTQNHTFTMDEFEERL